MTSACFVRKGNVLAPANRAAQIEIDRVPQGAVCVGKWTRPRNGKFHRLAWQVFTLVSRALNAGPGAKTWRSVDVKDTLLLATGRGERIDLPPRVQLHYAQKWGLPDGAIVVGLRPASISYARMDQDTFAAFYKDAMTYLTTTFGDWLHDSDELQELRRIFMQEVRK